MELDRQVMIDINHRWLMITDDNFTALIPRDQINLIEFDYQKSELKISTSSRFWYYPLQYIYGNDLKTKFFNSI